MSTANTISVNSSSHKINFTVKSEPTPPEVTIRCTTTATSFMTVDGNSVNITSNVDSSSRFGIINITATTTADSAYNGIASATSSYTVNQDAYVPPVTDNNVYLERPNNISVVNVKYNDTDFNCNFGAWVVVVIDGVVTKLDGRGQTQMMYGYQGADERWGGQVGFNDTNAMGFPYEIKYDSKYAGSKIQIGYCVRINELGPYFGSRDYTIGMSRTNLSIPLDNKVPVVIGEEILFVQDVILPTNGGTISDMFGDLAVVEFK